ncbi:MAG: hypothetical protein QN716_09820, partial [Nitrososphaeraceae archaeon]|nr:hypothetical protein [Nitrososphaeraceae archaeon]
WSDGEGQRWVVDEFMDETDAKASLAVVAPLIIIRVSRKVTKETLRMIGFLISVTFLFYSLLF